MATRKPLRKTVNEAVDITFTFAVDVDTTGETLTGIAQLTDGSGSVITLGTTSGAAANADITIALQTSALITGEWYFEIWADYEGNSPVLIIPAAGDVFIMDIQERIGVDAIGTFDATFDETFF